MNASPLISSVFHPDGIPLAYLMRLGSNRAIGIRRLRYHETVRKP